MKFDKYSMEGIGNKDWTSIEEIIPLVDLKDKRVVQILKNSYMKPALPMNLSI